MRLEIKVVAGARKNMIKADASPLRVYLTAPAVDGKANKALVDFLSEYYKITKTNITIISGLKSRRKTIMIEGI
ncbi:MAG TPA: DUF167 domain-containing protein [Candidatus Omnitrophota bacterium]|nr:DUF167 domain-containing protein [Candidatus Omnitrophota bacterium]HQL41773.1 DUF167 domain-containing protein [Candidatus Omnitrophota bacterium]